MNRGGKDRSAALTQRVIPMDQAELNNWKSIAEKMEANGTTESWFYKRAKAIAEGKPDPMPEISQLMPDSV
tara:strand:- start:79 stop:291 length:213 start_codon:yes stop_codon:yes gene_type:complete